jgi:hypothetical protein
MLGYKTLKINVNFIRKKSGNILKIHVTNKQNEKKKFFFLCITIRSTFNVITLLTRKSLKFLV